MDASHKGVDEAVLLKSLSEGDEDAFTWLVQQYHSSLVRVALSYVEDEVLAEEVAQETWIAVLRGLDRFESRSSLKTWIFTILVNRAKTYSQREKRNLLLSEFEDLLENEPTVDPGRFFPHDSQKSPGHWIKHPTSWEDIPENIMLSRELMNVVLTAISALPSGQMAVITLCDIEGFSTEETCNILGVSETNQRVLLHRARAKIRSVLENYLKPEM